MHDKIDFVITWVNGDDPRWQAEKRRYDKNVDYSNDDRKARYRDLDTLKYWFRSVEKNAAWVNKIYFVTWGHIPTWLNTNNDRLIIVKHDDFIPKQYLPTFNSCAIEMNLHRIKGLSENFVYFNDDMFVMNKTKPTDFFKNGKPRDAAILSVITPSGKDMFEHRLVNNSTVLNRRYKLIPVIKKHPFKWFNPKYGTKQFQSVPLIFKKKFSTIRISHIPSSLKKSTFRYLWENERSAMENTSSQRFRSITCVNPWLVQALQMASGDFCPRSPKFGKLIKISDDMSEVSNTIKHDKSKLLCVNDSAEVRNIEKAKTELVNAFEEKFPDKSSFEK